MLPAGHLRNDVWISFRQEMILEEYVNVCVQPSEKEWDMLERGLRLPVETIGDFCKLIHSPSAESMALETPPLMPLLTSHRTQLSKSR